MLLKNSFRQADRILSAFDLFWHAFLLPLILNQFCIRSVLGVAGLFGGSNQASAVLIGVANRTELDAPAEFSNPNQSRDYFSVTDFPLVGFSSID
ncbi:hypothetical protein [Rhodopirellula baltica]